MTAKSAVEAFLSQKTIAVVGASRSGKKFGNGASRELRKKGYRVIPVHPEAEEIDGEKCYSTMVELPDTVGAVLVVVPPAETEKVVAHAKAKRKKKGADWVLANDVSRGTGTFGGDRNVIHLIDDSGVEDWPAMSKDAVARRLAERIADHLAAKQ